MEDKTENQIPKFCDRTFHNLFPFTGSVMGFKKRMQMWADYYSNKKSNKKV